MRLYVSLKLLLKILALLMIIIIFGCTEKVNKNAKNDSFFVEKEKIKVKNETNFDPLSVDELISKNITNFLINDYLKSDLKFLQANDRKFQMYKIDLNDDGIDEYFIRFMSSYFCGSGGCTYLLLDRYSEIITVFTVMDSPIYLTNEKANGWYNLYVDNNRADRVLKFNGKTYPSNPSIAEETTIDKSKIKKVIFDDENKPAFTYSF